MIIDYSMKERPILFSGPMVRAILDGRKTVTRRPVRGFQIPTEDTAIPVGDRHRWCATAQRDPRYGFCVFGATEVECAKELEEFAPCPHGRRGERLWVREAWAADAQVDAIAPRDLSHGEPIFYPADGAVRQTGCSMITQGRGRPSIHMPRWACRILLEITDVRVERLQEISEAEIEREGIDLDALADGQDRYDMCHAGSGAEGRPTLRTAWRHLWESTGGDWAANPWVWVVEFKRVTP